MIVPAQRTGTFAAGAGAHCNGWGGCGSGWGHAEAPREECHDDRWIFRADRRNHGMSVVVHKVKLVQGETGCTVLIAPSAVVF